MRFDDPRYLTTLERQFEYHRQDFCDRTKLSQFALDPPQFEAEASREMRHLVASVYHAAYGYPIDPNAPAARVVEWTAEFSAPASWWDAFKLHFALRWWMRWWVAKHPVKHTRTRKDFKETITARALLPEVPVGPRHYFVMSGGRPYMEGFDGAACPYCKGVGYDSRFMDYPFTRAR